MSIELSKSGFMSAHPEFTLTDYDAVSQQSNSVSVSLTFDMLQRENNPKTKALLNDLVDCASYTLLYLPNSASTLVEHLLDEMPSDARSKLFSKYNEVLELTDKLDKQGELIEWLLGHPQYTCQPRSDEWHEISYTCTCGHAQKMQEALAVVAERNTV